MGRLQATTKSKAVKPARVKPARQVQRLSEVNSFTDAAFQLQKDNFLNAQQKIVVLANEYQASRQLLLAAGKLDRDVEAEFRKFAEASAFAVTGLTADFGDSLHVLVSNYSGRRNFFSRRGRP